MNDRCQFSKEEWSNVAKIIGDLGGVTYVDFRDDTFELVGFLDPNVLEDFKDDIRPATLEVIRAHIENHLAAARGAVKAIEIIRQIGQHEAETARAAQTLLDRLEFYDTESKGLPPAAARSMKLRAQLRDLAATSQEQSEEVLGWVRKPASRPQVPHYRIEFWSYLMRLWTDVLHRAPTNSPGGPLAQFINAASAPARDILDPAESKAFEFVKQHRKQVWGKALSSEDQLNP